MILYLEDLFSIADIKSVKIQTKHDRVNRNTVITHTSN